MTEDHESEAYAEQRDLPAMPNRRLIQELYRDMKFVRPAVEALQAARLPERVDDCESWQDRWSGRVAGLAVIGGAILSLLVAHVFGILKAV